MELVRTALLIIGLGGLGLAVAYTGIKVARGMEDTERECSRMQEFRDDHAKIIEQQAENTEAIEKLRREIEYLKAENGALR